MSRLSFAVRMRRQPPPKRRYSLDDAVGWPYVAMSVAAVILAVDTGMLLYVMWAFR